MDTIQVVVENYKRSTRGLSLFLKIIFALLLIFIFFSVISAFVNVFAGL